MIEKIEPEELERLDELTFAVENNFESYIQDVAQSTEFHKQSGNLQKVIDVLSKESRTAKLWIQYMHYIQVLKDFVRAERTGNWSLHLHTGGKMLNHLAATGHIHYAKSAWLCLQQMLRLKDDFPCVYANFMEEGLHTVRKSSRFWGGLWTDLIIEQVLMRSIKSRGGMTARGVQESVRTLWVNTAHRSAAVHEAMGTLTNSFRKTSDQHVEFGESRMKKDAEDLEKITSWFTDNKPF